MSLFSQIIGSKVRDYQKSVPISPDNGTFLQKKYQKLWLLARFSQKT